MLYAFVRAAITKFHRVGGFNNRNLFSHSSRGYKIKVLAGVASSVVSLLGL